MTTRHPPTAWKVLTGEQWAAFQAAGLFAGAPVDLADGYVHLSTAEQLGETLLKHFAGQIGLVAVEVDLALLGASVRWEASRGGALFPHVYASLPMAAVRGVKPVTAPPAPQRTETVSRLFE